MHLVVGNGGLGNGISREIIKNLFLPHGSIQHILMQESKSYCFVSFMNIESAEEAYSALHGVALSYPDQIPVPGIKLYLAFTDTIPDSESSKSEMPRGLKLIPDFVTEEEETLLLSSVVWDSVDTNLTDGARQSLKHRKVKHYGYEFIYGVNNVNRQKPLQQDIPEQCQPIIERMKQRGCISHTPDQLTVNQYLPGQGIPPHVDTHSAFEDGIASLSLGSQAIMEFRAPDGRHSAVLLPRRSLLVMSGESRYMWTHGITPRKHDVIGEHGNTRSESERGACGEAQQEENLTLVYRETRTSFTFRKIRHQTCNCKYPAQCDDQLAGRGDKEPTQLPSSDSDAQLLEALHVHQVYEEIAGHFSDTRHSPWPKVVEFLQSVPSSAIIFDVGCGNGKYLSANPNCFQMGCDRSSGLCAICVERGFPVLVADCLALPVRSESVDVCISIAVIHHLSTHERRIEAVREMMRVLRPGGQALISVWALEQRLKNTDSNYITKQKRPQTDTPASLTASVHTEAACKDSGCAGLQSESVNNTDNTDNENIAKQDATLSERCSRLTTNDKSDVVNVSGYSQEITAATEEKQFLSVHKNRTEFKAQDLLVPWHLRKRKTAAVREKEAGSGKSEEDPVFHRYYHVFKQGELEQLCACIKYVHIKTSYYDQGNWCAIIEKLSNNY